MGPYTQVRKNVLADDLSQMMERENRHNHLHLGQTAPSNTHSNLKSCPTAIVGKIVEPFVEHFNRSSADLPHWKVVDTSTASV